MSDKPVIPDAVKAAFSKMFPGVDNPGWELDIIYEADFQRDGKEIEASFEADGTLIQAEYEIDPSELPAAVKSAIREFYPNGEIEEAERIEGDSGVMIYEIEIETDDDTIELHITPDGKVIAMGDDL